MEQIKVQNSEKSIQIKVGDRVTRKSYGNDIEFKVTEIKKAQNGKCICILIGVKYRLESDAPVEDLILVKDRNLNRISQKMKETYDIQRDR